MNWLLPHELVALAESHAADSDWVDIYKQGRLEKRVYQELQTNNSRYNAWCIVWNREHDTGLHDHDGSAGGVYVCKGLVIESRLKIVNGELREVGDPYGPDVEFSQYRGKTFSFGPWDIHRVRHFSGEPAVTIHCYSPPLDHMGSYGIIDDELKRMPTQSELMPLEKAIHQDRKGLIDYIHA
jgi:hypothetical protein